MDTYPQQIEIEINRPKLEQYIKIQVIIWPILLCIILAFFVNLLLLGLGIILLLMFLATVGNWLIRSRVAAYEYYIEGNYIRIKSGIFFKSDFLIPLNEVKSFLRYQGPVMKYLNIGGIVIERDSPKVAASVEDKAIMDMFQPRLKGLKEPEKVLDTLGKIKAIRTMNASKE